MIDVLRISVPLTTWLAAFSAVYGLEGIICSERWAEAALGLPAGRAALIVAWLLAIAIQVALLLALRSRRFGSPSAFARGVSVSLALAALVATVWTGLPVATTSLCL